MPNRELSVIIQLNVTALAGMPLCHLTSKKRGHSEINGGQQH